MCKRIPSPHPTFDRFAKFHAVRVASAHSGFVAGCFGPNLQQAMNTARCESGSGDISDSELFAFSLHLVANCMFTTGVCVLYPRCPKTHYALRNTDKALHE